MVDLGKWLGEEYRVSEPLRPDHFAEFEELSGEGLDAFDDPRNQRPPTRSQIE